MRIAIIDNYDSFVYNLKHVLEELGAETVLFKNDGLELRELEPFDKILLSPGPGVPSEAGRLLEIIHYYAGRKPILGICLGEQAIGEVFGAKLFNLPEVCHGVQSFVRIVKKDTLFANLPECIWVGRYHSWVVDAHELPDCLEVTAVNAEGQIMALRHRILDIKGLQFHPESILTPDGKQMMKNWLEG